MKTRDFYYDLPKSLIAQHPGEQRGGSRLLHLERRTGICADRRFTDLLEYLQPHDCLVFNDTKVIPARLYGAKASGGKLEVLIERLLDGRRALAHIRCSKSPKPGSNIIIHAREGDARQTLQVEARRDDLFVIASANGDLAQILEQCGHMPLPPYIERDDAELDQERYQTVYAQRPGAVAAPTAGLHFDEAMLQAIDNSGVTRCHVTLHVGAGTFQPVRVDDISQHKMHTEVLEVSQQAVDACKQAREQGGRIIAVGTTAVRSLETASQSGELQPFRGETDIFITPGYRFKSVDALLTNFHLPESTLIMLVSAFAGHDQTMAAYRHAVEQQYHFFSYGDAMLIT